MTERSNIDFDRVDSGTCARCGGAAIVRMTFNEPDAPATSLLSCSTCYRAFGRLVLGVSGPAADLYERLADEASTPNKVIQ